MRSIWVKNDELHRDYQGYVFDQVIPGHEYSLIRFQQTQLPPNPDEDPYFEGCEVIEYIEHDETFYVLIQIQPHQNHEFLFAHLKTISMTLPDTPERNSIPTRHYNITALLSGDGDEHMSQVLIYSTDEILKMKGKSSNRESISLFLPVPS